MQYSKSQFLVYQPITDMVPIYHVVKSLVKSRHTYTFFNIIVTWGSWGNCGCGCGRRGIGQLRVDSCTLTPAEFPLLVQGSNAAQGTWVSLDKSSQILPLLLLLPQLLSSAHRHCRAHGHFQSQQCISYKSQIMYGCIFDYEHFYISGVDFY